MPDQYGNLTEAEWLARYDAWRHDYDIAMVLALAIVAVVVLIGGSIYLLA